MLGPKVTKPSPKETYKILEPKYELLTQCFLSMFCMHNLTFFQLKCVNRSELVQRVGINEIAESMMAFNTNYKDTGLFGVYAIAKVR